MSRTDGGDAQAAALPRITVVMPVYNGAAFLEDQVRTILAQRGVALRLVISDDGSTDRSPEILARLAAEDPRISLRPNARNLGLMRTLARLFAEVDGDYVSLADQDDLWDDDKLIVSINRLRETGAALVYSDVRLIDAGGRVTAPDYLRRQGIFPLTGTDARPFVFRNPVIGHTVVAKAALAPAFAEIPSDLMFHEAWLVGCACRTGSVVFVDRVLGSYRQHASNVIGSRGKALGRLSRLFGRAGTLARRQRTRQRALAALSRLDPALIPVATRQQAQGWSKLSALPGQAAFFLSLSGQIGLLPALTEMALFLIQPASPAAEDRNTAPGLQTPEHREQGRRERP